MFYPVRFLARIPLLHCAGLLLLVLTGVCVAADRPLQVAASIPPQGFFLRQVAGDKVNVLVLLSSGGDPHSYEPTPQQMQGLAESDVFFSAGLQVEAHWKPDILSARNAIRWVDTPVQQSADRHFWLSPKSVIVHVQTMIDVLGEMDPDNRSVYQSNGSRFLQEVKMLHQEFSTMYSDLKGHNTFLVAHPAWDDFAASYGLNQIVIEDEGKSVTPKHLAHVIRQSAALNITTIFADNGHSLKNADTIAAALRATVVVLKPMSGDWLTELRNAAALIREGLR